MNEHEQFLCGIWYNSYSSCSWSYVEKSSRVQFIGLGGVSLTLSVNDTSLANINVAVCWANISVALVIFVATIIWGLVLNWVQDDGFVFLPDLAEWERLVEQASGAGNPTLCCGVLICSSEPTRPLTWFMLWGSPIFGSLNTISSWSPKTLASWSINNSLAIPTKPWFCWEKPSITLILWFCRE